jgi:hypothetical protein
MGAFDDQRRRQRDHIAGGADQQVLVVEAAGEHVVGAGADGARARREFDRADQADSCGCR